MIHFSSLSLARGVYALDQIDTIHKVVACFYIQVTSLVEILNLQVVGLVEMVDGRGDDASSSVLVEVVKVVEAALIFTPLLRKGLPLLHFCIQEVSLEYLKNLVDQVVEDYCRGR